MVTKVERWRGGINKEFGININTLLYSTGNSVFCNNLNEKGVCRRVDICVCVCVYIYIYISLNHFVVHLKLTQCYESTTLQYKIKIKKE